MASIAGTAILSSVRPPRQSLQVPNGLSSLKSVSIFSQLKNVSIRLRPARSQVQVRVSCAAKPETVEKVCGIVKKQLALSDEVTITGESTFAQLGADSLDTVEVVMGLEEEFEINVEEESAQNIQTVQDAANLIEKLVEKKRSAA